MCSLLDYGIFKQKKEMSLNIAAAPSKIGNACNSDVPLHMYMYLNMQVCVHKHIQRKYRNTAVIGLTAGKSTLTMVGRKKLVRM